MSEIEMTKAAADVLAERRRQIEAEGWTPEHDDGYKRDELACAAACYCMSSVGVLFDHFEDMWPWDVNWFKRADPRRDLVKAAALILAEIERLDRMKHGPKPYLDWHGDPFPGQGNDWMKHCLERPIKREELAEPSRKYGIENPPRLRKPGESLHEYRIAMGWESQSADDRHP